MSDSLHQDKDNLAEQKGDLRGEMDEANRLLRQAREATQHEHDRAEAEKKRADAEYAEAASLRKDLTAAERKILLLEAQLGRMRDAADDASAASIVASARSMLGRCTLASSRWGCTS